MFRPLSKAYGTDGNSVWYGSEKIEDANAMTFEVNDDFPSYGKDSQSVYFMGKTIIGADPSSWEPIHANFAKGASAVFYLGDKIPLIDPKTFTVVGDQFFKDATRAGYRSTVFSGVDVATFEFVDCTTRSPSTDIPTSLSLLCTPGPPSYCTAKDKNREYTPGESVINHYPQ